MNETEQDNREYSPDSISLSEESVVDEQPAGRISLSEESVVDEQPARGFSLSEESVVDEQPAKGISLSEESVVDEQPAKGESGLGKSTLINTLYLQDLYKDRALYDARGKQSILSWKSVLNYVEQQFEQYHMCEASPNRRNIQDNRVHCCLYFISPYGHGLKPTDVEVMKALHEKVNIVPVLAKADCLTLSEIQTMKARILNELHDYRIKIFQFPECDSDEDELLRKQDLEMKSSIPFAVVGSNTKVECQGKRLRARLYPWGVVEVENPAHCDFVHLRNMLVRTHMQDLKDMTQDVLYENYRMQFLCRKKVR
ncbi:septin-5-like isoform X2 [Salminus brasiliensis]|uniref:septin-5-like isoform X2 n=1 Tax=Salminus brasiliensis TaxID=930266 RepID=UPI003B834FF0